MNNKKFLFGTLSGGVTLFILGFIVYALLLENFFIEHAGSATGVAKTEMQFWPLIVGNLSLGALLAYLFLKWAAIKSFGEGFRAAVLIGFFIAFGYDMIMYDTSNIMDLTATLVDIIAFSAMMGIAGGIIGLTVGAGSREKTPDGTSESPSSGS